MNKYKINGSFTLSDLNLLKYLLSNKVASRKQINRDVYLAHRPHSVCYRLKKLSDLGFIKAYRPFASRNDQSNIYSLTSKGLLYILSELKSPILKKRITSDSIEHDLDLVDIKEFFKSKDYILKYFTENQIHNEERFIEDDNLKIFNQLRFDALVEYSRDRFNKALIPIQYERTAKSKKRYEKIISEYYCESSISMIIYILADDHIRGLIQDTEKKIQKDKDVLKIFYANISDLNRNCELIKFYNQNNKFIAIK